MIGALICFSKCDCVYNFLAYVVIFFSDLVVWLIKESQVMKIIQSVIISTLMFFSSIAGAISVAPLDESKVNRTGNLNTKYHVFCTTYCNGTSFSLVLVNMSNGSSKTVSHYYAQPGTQMGTMISTEVKDVSTGSYRFELRYTTQSSFGGSSSGTSSTSEIFTVVND